MNLVFLNSFEKQGEDKSVTSAQVSISEQGGEWSVDWHEMGGDLNPTRICWYTGSNWSEMMQQFRSQLQAKRSEGFRAMVEATGEYSFLAGGKTRTLQMLQYYSELNSREELFQELRKWRNEQAAKESKSPFIIASNRMLRMLSAFVPRTVEELRMVPGFGEYKTGLYAEPIMRLTAVVERDTLFPLDWVADRIDPAGFEDWLRQQWDLRARSEAERREARLRLLEAAAEGLELAAVQQRLSLPSRELLSRIEELDKEGYDMEPLIDSALRGVPQAEREQAWQAFGEAGDRFLKPIVTRLYGAEHELSGAQLERTYEWLRLLRLRYRRAVAAGGASGAQAQAAGAAGTAGVAAGKAPLGSLTAEQSA
ncbi:HRDC domain-containing protein [Paenibacillus koleovorans]|uniref:HRDC domain-containing protein n=1 Tax=Paenibacillus koleovorans TaxID=121608 RepID=UPI000FD85AA6|nr:HRDC domain-containing protein [Paenibacillus koleovorans]